MTVLLTFIAVALTVSGASPWAIAITLACAIWALALETREFPANRRGPA